MSQDWHQIHTRLIELIILTIVCQCFWSANHEIIVDLSYLARHDDSVMINLINHISLLGWADIHQATMMLMNSWSIINKLADQVDDEWSTLPSKRVNACLIDDDDLLELVHLFINRLACSTTDQSSSSTHQVSFIDQVDLSQQLNSSSSYSADHHSSIKLTCHHQPSKQC